MISYLCNYDYYPFYDRFHSTLLFTYYVHRKNIVVKITNVLVSTVGRT